MKTLTNRDIADLAVAHRVIEPIDDPDKAVEVIRTKIASGDAKAVSFLQANPLIKVIYSPRRVISLDDLLQSASVPAECFNIQPDYPPPATRNLLMHIAPFAIGRETWRRNVDSVLQRMQQFNGRRVIAIATGDGLDAPAKVKELFLGEFIEFIEVANDPQLREVASFHRLFSRVRTDDAQQITFFCHAKGVTHKDNSAIADWTDIMYSVCLDYPEVVAASMANHPITGPFKKIGKFFSGRSDWHYSGSFYWFRNASVFSRQWWNIALDCWGTESWPSLIFSKEESGCLFFEGYGRTFDLYSRAYMDDVVLPAYKIWKDERITDNQRAH